MNEVQRKLQAELLHIATPIYVNRLRDAQLNDSKLLETYAKESIKAAAILYAQAGLAVKETSA